MPPETRRCLHKRDVTPAVLEPPHVGLKLSTKPHSNLHAEKPELSDRKPTRIIELPRNHRFSSIK